MESTRKFGNGSHERRRHERVWVVRGCRIRAVHRLRAEQAETANLSDHGALIRVGSHGTFGIGDEVEIHVAWDGQTVVRTEEAVRGIVKRVVPMDYHHQAIGVEFTTALSSGFVAPKGGARIAA